MISLDVLDSNPSEKNEKGNEMRAKTTAKKLRGRVVGSSRYSAAEVTAFLGCVKAIFPIGMLSALDRPDPSSLDAPFTTDEVKIALKS